MAAAACLVCPEYDFDMPEPDSFYVTHAGSFEQGGCRIYRVDLIAGRTYLFSFCDDEGSYSDDPVLEIYDSDCSLVAEDDDTCQRGSRLEYTPGASGAYYLKMKNWDDRNSETYTLTFKRMVTGPEIRIQPESLEFRQDGAGTVVAEQTSLSVTSKSLAGELQVTALFSEKSLKIQQKDEDHKIFFKGSRMPEETPGVPWLPAQYIQVLIPPGNKAAKLKVKAEEKIIAEDIDIGPAQKPARLSGVAPGKIKKDPAAYAMNSKFPKAWAQITGHHTMRGQSFVTIRLNPVRYNPFSKKLFFASNLKLSIKLDQKPDQKSAVLIPTKGLDRFQELMQDLVVNEELLDQTPVQATETEPDSDAQDQVDYLVITSSTLQPAFQVLADHRETLDDFSTAVITTEEIYGNPAYDGVDSQARIRNCIKDYAENRGTVYVVLGGDDTVVPDRDCRVSVASSSGPEVEENMPTDLYYAGLDSTWDEDEDGVYGEAETDSGPEGDLAPDVFVGRISVRTADQAKNYISKLIEYETHPPSEDFLEKLMLMGDLLWDRYEGSDRPSDALDDGLPEFNDHSPVSDAEMWGRRLFRDAIHPWMETDYTCFYDTLTSWDVAVAGDYLQNASNLKTRLNEGWQNIFCDTHGNKNIFGLESGYFYSSDALALNQLTTIVYTNACLTGHFDGSTDPALSEAFLRNGEGGAIAYFGCSRYGWGWADEPPADEDSKGGPSMEYAYLFYNELTRYPGYPLGVVFAVHKVLMAGLSTDDGAYRWIQFGLNFQGDPAFRPRPADGSKSLTIYNDGTQDLDIQSISSESNSSWLSWEPSSPLLIPPEGQRTIWVKVDFDQAEEGINQDRLLILSNDSDESPYPTGVFITAEKAVSEVFVDLKKGFNLVSLPGSLSSRPTANDWLDVFGTASQIKNLMVYDTGTGNFLTFIPDTTSNPDFTLKPGQGLIVNALEERQISLGPADCTGIDLEQGFNLMGMPCPSDGYSAYELLQKLGSGNIVSIQRYNSETGAFETAAFDEGALTGVDFEIKPGEGWFIQMNQSVQGVIP